jgi:hypothetical protein
MLRKALTVVVATVALSAAAAAPALAQTSVTVGPPACNTTATGPSAQVTTLPNPGVDPDGSVGASVNCPLFP